MSSPRPAACRVWTPQRAAASLHGHDDAPAPRIAGVEKDEDEGRRTKRCPHPCLRSRSRGRAGSASWAGRGTGCVAWEVLASCQIPVVSSSTSSATCPPGPPRQRTSSTRSCQDGVGCMRSEGRRSHGSVPRLGTFRTSPHAPYNFPLHVGPARLAAEARRANSTPSVPPAFGRQLQAAEIAHVERGRTGHRPRRRPGSAAPDRGPTARPRHPPAGAGASATDRSPKPRGGRIERAAAIDDDQGPAARHAWRAAARASVPVPLPAPGERYSTSEPRRRPPPGARRSERRRTGRNRPLVRRRPEPFRVRWTCRCRVATRACRAGSGEEAVMANHIRTDVS